MGIYSHAEEPIRDMLIIYGESGLLNWKGALVAFKLTKANDLRRFLARSANETYSGKLEAQEEIASRLATLS